jgi:hypothetical protein
MQPCMASTGKVCNPHKPRLMLATAPLPRDYTWRGFAYRILCETCGVPASVDLGGVIIAHPTRKGSEWCPMSHRPDVGGKKVVRP